MKEHMSKGNRGLKQNLGIPMHEMTLTLRHCCQKEGNEAGKCTQTRNKVQCSHARQGPAAYQIQADGNMLQRQLEIYQ